MLIISIIFGLCIFGVMAYLALSKKSRFWIRVAALIALGMMILAVIISILVIISGPAVVIREKVQGESGIPIEPPATAEASLGYLFFIFFLLAIFVMVLVLAIREHKRHVKKSAKS